MSKRRMHHKIDKIKQKTKVMGDYHPLPHQTEMHKNPSKFRAMVSGVGAGKTTLGCREIIKWSQMFPGGLYVIGRLTSKSLEQTTERRFFEICPTELMDNWNDSKKHLYLRTPVPGVYSEILFMHLDEPGPLGSLDIDGFWIDEAHEPDGAEVPESTFLMLKARLRGLAGPHRGLITTNSGGKDWVWKWFFNPERSNHHKKDYFGIVVPSEVNKANLPPNYIEDLRRDNPESWVKRFLDASFEVFEGQIFTEFDRRKHVIPAFEVPDSWPQEGGFDFGIRVPTAVPIVRIDPATGIVYLTKLYYRAEADIAEVAKWMKNNRQTTAWADPSVKNRGPNKKSPAMLYQEEGVTLIPSVSNDVDLKISTWHKYLIHNRFFIFDVKETQPAVNELENYRWNPNGNNQPLKVDDHFVDACGYLLMSNPTGSTLDPVDPKQPHSSPHPEVHPSIYEDEDYAPEEEF